VLVAQTIPRTVFAMVLDYLDASKFHLASLSNVNIRLFGKNLKGPSSVTNSLKNVNFWVKFFIDLPFTVLSFC
jgi:hypothetical protein